MEDFLQRLTNKASIMIKDVWILKDENGFIPNRGLCANEEYLRTNLLCLGEVESLLKQLDMASMMLSNFRTTTQFKKHKINRFEHIIYHIESHLLRLTGVIDRLLILVNHILQLGLTDYNCKARNMLVDDKGKKGRNSGPIEEIPNLFNSLNSLLTFINNFRDDRNEIAHAKRINYEDLRLVEMFNIVQSADGPNELEHMSNHIKVITDKKVAEYKKRMLEVNNKVRELLKPIYQELEMEFDKRFRSFSCL